MSVPDSSLTREQWHAAMARHHQLTAAAADACLERRSRRIKHPVHDFLFTYYSFPPSRLKLWLPPLGVRIEFSDDDAAWFPAMLSVRGVQRGVGWLALDAAAAPKGLADLAGWVAHLCRQILNRPPRFRCYGMHEWAMVYRLEPQQIRHQSTPLRLSAGEIAAVVESQSLCCSHYDAFRFFTEPARPLNAFEPALETRADLEQGACLHANMDLYKWSSKLWPWIGSDLVGEAYALAEAGRDLDMRASPYDLRHLGYEPVRVETPEGREQYEREQRDLALRAEPLRQRLMQAAEQLQALILSVAPASEPRMMAGR